MKFEAGIFKTVLPLKLRPFWTIKGGLNEIKLLLIMRMN